MPRKVLTDPAIAADDTRPIVGFFGKLPSTGDFVARGLPDAFRRNWDAWVTRHVAPLQRGGRAFPDGGLRFHLVSGGRMAAGVILPSGDSAGRQFPLSILLVAEGSLARPQIDAWCDAAIALLTADATPDTLWLALDGLPAPTPGKTPAGQMQLWTRSHPPIAVNPDAAEQTVRQLFA